MRYKNESSIVVDKFEDTLNNPQAFKVGRFDPKGSMLLVVGALPVSVMKLQIK